MPSIINSDDGVVSGTSGLKSTGGNDGLLNIQSNGSTVVAMTGSGVSVTGTLTASGATTLSGAVSASSLSVNSNNISADNSLGFRNRIINGAMVIDQRNAGASFTPTDGQYTLDRWRAGASAASKFSVQQSSVAPAGFSFSMLCTSLSAYSVTTNDNFEMFQYIEGFNTADLGWGTANAQTVTLSFWVRSSLTGTFGGAINNSAFNRSYPFSYTILAANTWEQKSITIAGDTSGTWVGATNGIGIVVCIGLGAGTGRSGTAGAWSGSTFYNATGATSVVGTNGATFYITGVQLEVGSVATPFERRPYGTELALCQRYAYPIRGGYCGFANGTTVADVGIQFPVEMRVSPTVTQGTLTYIAYGNGGAFTQSASLNSLPTQVTQNGGTLRFSNFTGLTANNPYVVIPSSGGTLTTYACILTAEL